MSWWDSYRAVHGAELRVSAREFSDHGWPVVVGTEGLLLVTGSVLDVVELPADHGRRVCSRLRACGVVVPVAATPAGGWWFPVAVGSGPVDPAATEAGVILHTAGRRMLAPPSEVADGWVHWRVAPALTGYRLPPGELIRDAARYTARRRSAVHDVEASTQRLAPVGAGTRG